MDQLPHLEKRELVCLLSFTCNYLVSVRRGFLFLWVLGMGCVILLWHSLSLPYNYFDGLQMEYSSILKECWWPSSASGYELAADVVITYAELIP